MLPDHEQVHQSATVDSPSTDPAIWMQIIPQEFPHFKELKPYEVRVLNAAEIDDALLTEIESAQYGEGS